MLKYFNAYVIYPFLEKLQKRNICSKVKRLHKVKSTSLKENDNNRKQKLYEICKNASLNVPYYRNLFKELNFDPESILEDISNIKKLPYLTKQIIQKEGSRLISEKLLYSETLHERKTGGSTGASTLIYYSQEALDWTAASNLHAISWTGKKRHMREIHLSSYFPETFPLQDRIKEWVKCLALNRTNVATHAFDDIDMQDVIEKIKAANVYYLEGHPSTLYAIAEYIKKQDLTFKTPLFNVFESTGEVLDSQKRKSIEKYIGCKVYDRYGNAEFGVVAHENDDSKHTLKVLDSMVIPEIFDWTQSDKEHSLEMDENGIFLILPTKKMEKIWKSRVDLQKAFPYALTAQSEEFWNWWMRRSSVEYDFENILPIQLLDASIPENTLKNILIKLVWDTRPDLKDAFQTPYKDNQFIAWWGKFGISEYYKNIQQYENSNELVLTTLTNSAMPLIRYRTGDMIGSLEKKEDGYYIDNIEGRVHDMVKIGAKIYPTHYIQDLLDRIGGIVEFQVEELDYGMIKLYLVVPDINIHDDIKNRLKVWWKEDIEIEFIKLNQLKRVGWRDKFRYVIPKQDHGVNNV